MYLRWYTQIQNPEWLFTVLGCLYIYGNVSRPQHRHVSDDFVMSRGIPFRLWSQLFPTYWSLEYNLWAPALYEMTHRIYLVWPKMTWRLPSGLNSTSNHWLSIDSLTLKPPKVVSFIRLFFKLGLTANPDGRHIGFDKYCGPMGRPPWLPAHI
jgi:hypothetical protein